jgi:hypothetical protein
MALRVRDESGLGVGGMCAVARAQESARRGTISGMVVTGCRGRVEGEANWSPFPLTWLDEDDVGYLSGVLSRQCGGPI